LLGQRSAEAFGWQFLPDVICGFSLSFSKKRDSRPQRQETPAEADPAAMLKRARALLSRGAKSDAIAILTRAVALNPCDGALATCLGYSLHLNGQIAAAAAEYRRALALDAARFDAWYALGCAELAGERDAEAIRCFRRALALRPGSAQAHFDLGRALFGTGDIDAALDSFRIAAADRSELRREAFGRIARYIPGSPRADNATVLDARREWAALEAAAEGIFKPPRRRPRSSGRKLRIGYVSAFLRPPNWLKPVWGVINRHDRARFDIHLFSDGDPPNEESGYSRHPRDRIHDIRSLSNRELAAAVVRLGIDILVDLNGYSFQSRFGFFMRRPAPVIIGWFNMYATTGIDAFDYIVGDDSVIPEEEERFYTERVVRVPGSYIAFSVLYPVPDVAPPPCITTGSLTFGSFASQYKLTDGVIGAWATILRQAPGSRLLLKNRTLADASNQGALHERFRRHDIPTERVLLDGPAEHREFLAAYARIDIALDTFPYNGGTTTTEALWQGVPVLTFNGDRWVSRTSRSLLLAAGLGEWCEPDLAAYIGRAVSLARAETTPAELAALRAAMRARLSAAPVCDSAALCHALEDLYRDAAHAPSRRAPPGS
jgi:protein O-GlcNAc transferase